MAVNVFKQILKELTEMNKNFPDLRFGAVLQNGLDEELIRNNVNLTDLSNKKILTSLKNYNANTTKRRNK